MQAGRAKAAKSSAAIVLFMYRIYGKVPNLHPYAIMLRPASLIIIFLVACHPATHYPPGGYDYPKHFSTRDTNYYYYPIRNKVSRLDSIYNSWVYFTYRSIDEPNLSLAP